MTTQPNLEPENLNVENKKFKQPMELIEQVSETKILEITKEELTSYKWAKNFSLKKLKKDLPELNAMYNSVDSTGKRIYNIDFFDNYLKAHHLASIAPQHKSAGRIITNTMIKDMKGTYKSIRLFLDKFFIDEKIINSYFDPLNEGNGTAASYSIEPIQGDYFHNKKLTKFFRSAVKSGEINEDEFLELGRYNAEQRMVIEHYNKAMKSNVKETKDDNIEDVYHLEIERLKIPNIEKRIKEQNIFISNKEVIISNLKDSISKIDAKIKNIIHDNDFDPYIQHLRLIKKSPKNIKCKTLKELKTLPFSEIIKEPIKKSYARALLSDFIDDMEISKKDKKTIKSLSAKRYELSKKKIKSEREIQSSQKILKAVDGDYILYMHNLNASTGRDYNTLTNLAKEPRKLFFKEFIELDAKSMAYSALIFIGNTLEIELANFKTFIKNRNEIYNLAKSYETPLDPKAFFLFLIFGAKGYEFRETKKIYLQDSILKLIIEGIMEDMKLLKGFIKDNFEKVSLQFKWSFKYEDKNVLSLAFMNIESLFFNKIKFILNSCDLYRLHDSIIAGNIVPTIEQIEAMKKECTYFGFKLSNIEEFFERNEEYKLQKEQNLAKIERFDSLNGSKETSEETPIYNINTYNVKHLNQISTHPEINLLYELKFDNFEQVS